VTAARRTLVQAAVPVENRAGLAEADLAELAGVVSAHRSMKHVLDWALGHRPPLALADMVTQDEFSHDFLVAYPGGPWLVYDST
jgi:hypothetical protein